LLNWTSLGKSYINAYRLAYKEQFDKSIDGFINENYQEEESWI
jgi:hypothetical protein